jgi:predicted nucleotidyltransferase component of viral defense system
MLPINGIAEWGTTHPWINPDQVEQDLLLSRAICAIADDDYLASELTFRGGTALHKLFFPKPLRYSEDLDYVRSSAGGVGQVMRTLTDLGKDLGFTVRSKLSEHPKVFWRTTSQAGNPLKIKLEVNTHERSPALLLQNLPFRVESEWWSGEASVRTFQLAELIATKMRALYQRSKGRDLFDMWLAFTQADLDPERVLGAFDPYRPVGYTSKLAIANLELKLADDDFRHDLDELAAQPPIPYDPDAAAELIIESLLEKI